MVTSFLFTAKITKEICISTYCKMFFMNRSFMFLKKKKGFIHI